MTSLGIAAQGPRRRRDDPDSEYSGPPWQVAAIAKLGVPVVLSIGLVWFLAARVDKRIEDHAEQMDAHARQTAEMIINTQQMAATLENIEREHRDSGYRIEWLLRQLCLNASTTREERSQCLALGVR